jgi:hypothetical protein
MSQPDEPVFRVAPRVARVPRTPAAEAQLLIAVLEVATAKVRKSLAGPDADTSV